jgi:CotH kinase protein/Lamin Tail Domain/Chitobiase/beta-hexosaminidase C-terminal domain
MKPNLLLVFFLLGMTQMSFGQAVINEYSASNLEEFVDDHNDYHDWVELYNPTASTIDISGWHLSDRFTNPTKYEIPAGTTIPANSFIRFWCSGRDISSNGHYHTSFKLTQTKDNEILVLANPAGIIVESQELQLTLTEHSRCRAMDGGDTWRVCTAPTPGFSNNGSEQYAGYTAAPTMDIVAGFYDMPQTVTITNNEPNSVLRYTLDGKAPTILSPEYTAPLTINATTVVKAQAFSNDSDILVGKMDFNTYFINDNFTLPVFSVAADQLTQLANGSGGIIPIGSLEYFNQEKVRTAISYGSLNRHGQDSWVLPHRSLDWISRDEMGYTNAVRDSLFANTDRKEYQRFMFRASGDDNYPAINDWAHEGSAHIRDEYVQALAQKGSMKLDVRSPQRVVVFLNGQYWGVYGLRERTEDHDYTDHYYNQDQYHLQHMSTWGNTEIDYGGQRAKNEWENFRDFILNNDMGVEANYKIVTDSLNVLSLMDYFIVNLNVVASDWINYNTGWWRGLNPEGDHKKWGYVLWDLDATFDYYINYSGVPNTDPDAEPCDINDIAAYMDDFFDDNGQNVDVGKHEKIFLKLQLENEEFRQLYYSRQADMMNTVFSCENMIFTLDSMLSIIEPEMPRQIQRWGGTITEWNDNVQQLRDFVAARCELLDEGMVSCFDLTGPYTVTLMVDPPLSGKIELNTLTHGPVFPWAGDYFGGMENLLNAIEFDGGLPFAYWSSTSGQTTFTDSLDDKTAFQLTQNDTIIAHFGTVSSTRPNVTIEIGLSVIPNPSAGYCTIQYQLKEAVAHELSLLDVTGRTIWSQSIQQSAVGQQNVPLDLTALGVPAGLFLVKVQTADGVQVVKLNNL